jgi:hypothetical protein
MVGSMDQVVESLLSESEEFSSLQFNPQYCQREREKEERERWVVTSMIRL